MEHQIKKTPLKIKKANLTRVLYEENKEKIGEYINRLVWWNKKINLVSRDVSRETMAKHVEHSLVVSQSALFIKARKVLDSGTGGGLPGIPLAIISPEKEVLLNDVVTKKIMACKSMIRDLGLTNVAVKSGSIEGVGFNGDELLVSKHAFKIDGLISLLEGKPWKKIVLLKGGEEVGAEIEKIEEPLNIEIIDLYPGFDDSFYRGKAMVEISKRSNYE
ncbi:RsmG family class I SAM-dependent methyltransferase [Gracilimonas sp.]|uniref:16S rRNA (guanine(527)-N(7))-methyltransferase RsmG n=1 Tax=Gracilimonas sp. TaxID=1974203 RepID=UPI0032EBF2D3